MYAKIASTVAILLAAVTLFFAVRGDGDGPNFSTEEAAGIARVYLNGRPYISESSCDAFDYNKNGVWLISCKAKFMEEDRQYFIRLDDESGLVITER